MEQVPETVPAAAPYQVFINHRGPDVKKTLASLIYNRLTKCHGLSVFLDEKEIHTGDTLSPAIIGAIQSASVHVCIFSGRYAESSWCLNELYWILRSHNERNTEIIPVFYDVEPLDLRRIENGRYAEVFEKHQRKGREPMEVIKNWKTALNQASEISGQEFKTNERWIHTLLIANLEVYLLETLNLSYSVLIFARANPSEWIYLFAVLCFSDFGQILEKIVDSVLKEVFKREALEVAKYPVGLDQAAEDFRNEILNHSHSNATKIVGIAGLGGVGKSTLAEYFYNLRRPHFRRSSILFEVGKRSWRSSQEKLLRDLLGNYNP